MNKPLRASDLQPGRIYMSPSGRLCRLLDPNDNGLSRTSFLFAYVARDNRRSKGEDDGFAILASNATTIAAMREVAVERST